MTERILTLLGILLAVAALVWLSTAFPSETYQCEVEQINNTVECV